MKEQVSTGLGIMSGTSLDGIDIALCELTCQNGVWHYSIVDAETYAYQEKWQKRLAGSRRLSGLGLCALSNDWARLASDNIHDFCEKYDLHPGYIASHGHTVFHQPEKKITLQIGNGAVMAANTGKPVICDFRSQDVELGGQGAPLVAIGDKLLFREYKYCLNLGGFANISFGNAARRIAFDVCPCNIVLNYLAGRKGLKFDMNGKIAENGKVIPGILENLNNLPYYGEDKPKSLGLEWAEKNIFPLLEGHTSVDLLRTFTEHIAYQIARIINRHGSGKVLVTGGGAYNIFLLSRIRALTTSDIIVPEKKLVDYKEALIFAFLGLLRIQGKINVLASVTGAKHDHSSGCLYG